MEYTFHLLSRKTSRIFRNMSSLRDLIREIHRRSMWQVTAIYIGGSWLAFELIKQIAESADQPWLPNVALVLLIIGFVIVLSSAYVQERPDKDVSQETGETSSAETTAEPAVASASLFTGRNIIVAVGLVAAALFTVINTGIWTIGGSENVDIAETPEVALPDAASVVVLPMDNIGVQIRSVSPASNLLGQVQKGDMLVAIDGD